MQKATLRVLSSQKLDVQADNNTVLDVEVGLFEGDTQIDTRRLNFPLETSQDELKFELTKFLENYNLEREQAEANKAQDAAHAAADETIAALEGFTIGDNVPEAPAAETTEATEAPAATEGEAGEGVDAQNTEGEAKE